MRRVIQHLILHSATGVKIYDFNLATAHHFLSVRSIYFLHSFLNAGDHIAECDTALDIALSYWCKDRLFYLSRCSSLRENNI